VKIEEQIRGDVAVLSIGGEFDTIEVEGFEGAVASLIQRKVVRVVVSLEKLTFINSTALGCFLKAQERLSQAGGDIACAALSPFAAKTFRILGLDQKVRCFKTTDEAMAALRGGAR
jgi:stage II sporulation protein AA (anti-sigma F factor antagonist)